MGRLRTFAWRVASWRFPGDLPVVTWLLAAGILLVAWQVTGFTPGPADLERVAFTRDDWERGDWTQGLLAVFAHGGLIHLLVNVTTLLSVGPLVERRIGPLPALFVYGASAFAGLAAHVASRPDVPVVGASGALFGWTGLLMVVEPRAQMTLFFLFDMTLLFFGALYAAAVPLLLKYDVGTFIAHEAHLGGMFAGAAAAFLVSPRKAVRVLPAALAVFALVTLIVGWWADFLSSARCGSDPGNGWLGCVAGKALADAWLLVETALATLGVGLAYAYLESKDL